MSAYGRLPRELNPEWFWVQRVVYAAVIALGAILGGVGLGFVLYFWPLPSVLVCIAAVGALYRYRLWVLSKDSFSRRRLMTTDSLLTASFSLMCLNCKRVTTTGLCGCGDANPTKVNITPAQQENTNLKEQLTR